VQSLSSSDPARIGVRQTGGGAVGSSTVEVLRLARAEQKFFDYTADPDATQITIGDRTVDVPAGADAAGAAAAINARADVGAYATVVGGQLVLSGKTTGVAFTAGGSQLAFDPDRHRPAQTAEVRIDGTLHHPTANTTGDLIPGVELQLKALTTGPVTVTVGAPGPDVDRLKARVKTFVDAYNATIDAIRTRTAEKPVAQPATNAEWARGALYGDSGLSMLLPKLRQAISEPVAGNPAALDQLAEMGVGVPGAQAGPATADRLAGRLVIDDAKLTAALTDDPQGVRRLLGGVAGTPGLTQRLEGLLDPVARLGDGDLARRAEAATAEISRLRTQSEQMDRRLELKEKRLRLQFTAMETALASSQTQGQWLNGQLSSLSRTGR
jgi:flagellar hook-associated protein 2